MMQANRSGGKKNGFDVVALCQWALKTGHSWAHENRPF
jgi:hypothetical protein